MRSDFFTLNLSSASSKTNIGQVVFITCHSTSKSACSFTVTSSKSTDIYKGPLVSLALFSVSDSQFTQLVPWHLQPKLLFWNIPGVSNFCLSLAPQLSLRDRTPRFYVPQNVQISGSNLALRSRLATHIVTARRSPETSYAKAVFLRPLHSSRGVQICDTSKGFFRPHHCMSWPSLFFTSRSLSPDRTDSHIAFRWAVQLNFIL